MPLHSWAHKNRIRRQAVFLSFKSHNCILYLACLELAPYICVNKQLCASFLHMVYLINFFPAAKYLKLMLFQDILQSEFRKFGRILNCRVVKDIVTGKSKQYAFIEFENLGSVDRALKDMQKEYIDGAEIIVEREAERRLPGWRPRRLGGGFGGRKESGQLRFGCQDRPFRKPIIATQKKDHQR